MNETAMSIYNAATEGMAPYCSIPVTSKETASMVFKALNDADEGVSDMINQSITVAGVFVQHAVQVDEKTGEAKDSAKVVLFDSEGHTYATISSPFYKGICNVCALIGTPETWRSPITIKILQKKVKRGSMLTFEVMDWADNINIPGSEVVED